MKSVNLFESWLKEVETDPNLRDCIVEYTKGHGEVSMLDICLGMDARYCLMA